MIAVVLLSEYSEKYILLSLASLFSEYQYLIYPRWFVNSFSNSEKSNTCFSVIEFGNDVSSGESVSVYITNILNTSFPFRLDK